MTITPNTMAEFCYKNISIIELTDALRENTHHGADRFDWQLSEDEWRQQVTLALAEHLNDAAKNAGNDAVTGEEIVAIWAKLDASNISIDAHGYIYVDGNQLNNDRLIDFYNWLAVKHSPKSS